RANAPMAAARSSGMSRPRMTLCMTSTLCKWCENVAVLHNAGLACFVACVSVADDAGEVVGLLHPLGDLLRPRHDAHQFPGLVGLDQLLMQMVSAALGQLEYGLDARSRQEVRILFADALDPEQVRSVNPLEDQPIADSCFLGEFLSPVGCRPLFEQGL